MREIKFRAWDDDVRVMRYWEELSNKEESDLCEYFKEHNVTNRERDIFLLQYTGLKDKNGKEIYEGDILKLFTEPQIRDISDPDYSIRVIAWKEDESKFDFQWINGNWQTSGFTLSKRNLEGSFEVIGNIYEHPKLLGKIGGIEV